LLYIININNFTFSNLMQLARKQVALINVLLAMSDNLLIDMDIS
jgi:hypothetical protein